ncbi:MAG: NAD(P)H-dependent oxidoreductase subunit E [Vulcanimicrobiaceae bacterium]
MDYCREKIGVSHLETTDDGVFSYEEVECLAACDRAPCAQVNLEFVYDLTKAKVDQLLADLRAGTHPIQPLVQTVKPGKTWKLSQDTGLKAAGARGVSDPNNAGGIGDPSGVKMFDLIVGKPQYEERSKERLVHETTLRPEIAEGGH